MRAFLTCSLLAILASSLPAQIANFQTTPGSPEGTLLQLAGMETDEAKKLALYDEFLAKYPKHAGAAYAWYHAQPLYLKTKALEKVIAAGEAVLAAEPTLSVAGYNALQACEQKGDAACILQWSGRTVEAARKQLAVKKPEDSEAAAQWANEVDYARQVIVRCEYAYFAAALRFTDPQVIVQMFEALDQTNPESQYAPATGGRYLAALVQLKDLAKAQAFAERAADNNRANEDVLLFAADVSLSTSKNYDKAAVYAGKLIAALPGQAAPQGTAPEEWEKKKTATLARAYWIEGTALGAKESWVECDKALRQGLPTIQASPAAKELLPGAYFYLGLANYNLSKATPKRDPARTADAKKYFTLCTQMPSPFQQAAAKNLNAMNLGK